MRTASRRRWSARCFVACLAARTCLLRVLSSRARVVVCIAARSAKSASCSRVFVATYVACSCSKDQRIRHRWSVRDVSDPAVQGPRACSTLRGADASIATDGPSNNSLRFEIQARRPSDLYVRMTAGDIRIEDIRGNKDIELHAGDVRIDVGRAEDYRSVTRAASDAAPTPRPPRLIPSVQPNEPCSSLVPSGASHGTAFVLHAKLKAGNLRPLFQMARF